MTSKLVRTAPEGVAQPSAPAELIAECRLGERDAQGRLYHAFHDRVSRLLIRMVGPQEAADVMQLVFLKVFQKIGQFSGQSKFETWLYRVTVNEALQYIRKQKRWTLQPLVSEPMSEHASHSERDEHRELLEKALAGLAAELRTIFVLREIEGLAYSEIAIVMEIPEGTVGSRLNRARGELRKRLAELGWEL